MNEALLDSNRERLLERAVETGSPVLFWKSATSTDIGGRSTAGAGPRASHQVSDRSANEHAERRDRDHAT